MAGRSRLQRIKVSLIAVAWLTVALTWGPATAAAKAGGRGSAPPGNNGTIKIDEAAFDGNGNDPHVGCDFFVNFFGYDGGAQAATLRFESWAPTRGGGVVERQTSWSVPDRTGGNQLDHRYGPVDLVGALAGVTPHPQQGHHVKLTVHVSGSQGADVKHKVFWVPSCAPGGAPVPPSRPAPPPRVPPTTPPTTAAPGVTSMTAPTTTTALNTTTSVSASPTSVPAPAPPTRVLGNQVTPQRSLARTGMTVMGLTFVGISCALVGIIGVGRIRRRAT